MKPKLKVRGKEQPVEVSINKSYAQLVQDQIVVKWQEILDLAIKVFDVPNALIMKLHDNDLEVFAKSTNDENMFKMNNRAQIGVGHYCETVLGNDERLIVPNALKDSNWDDNPDLKYNLVNYVGLPLKWPTGEMFGTMCILDHKENEYSNHQLALFDALKSTIEKDLQLLDSNVNLEKTLEDLEKTHDLLLEHEKNHLTNQLVSSITHEISTPIGVALTTASYLDYVTKKSKSTDADTMDKLQEGAELLQRNLSQAATLLKSFKKVTNDQSKLQIEMLDLEVYIKSVVLSLKYNMRKYLTQVIVDVPKHIVVKMNSGAFAQVIINLVTNAAVHAFKDEEDRQVIISAKVIDETLELIVSDNGIGMTQDQIEKIFDPFVRFDDNEDGSGLGLTIVKDIVEKTLKGSIRCHSDINIGTKFIINMPQK